MKKINYLFLFLMLFISINGCKKDEPEEQQQETQKVVEQVEISGVNVTNSNASNYTLVTSSQNATLDEEADVETITPYALLKDNNDNVVAVTYYNYDNDNIILSPKETAIALAIDEFEFFLDLDVFSSQEANDLKNAFYNFDGVQQLEAKITQVLAQQGYINDDDLTSELNYLRQKFRELDIFTNNISNRQTAQRNVNDLTPADFTFNSTDFRITNIDINSVSQAANNSYDLSLKIGNASRLVLGVVKGQENNGNFIPFGSDYQYLFTSDYEFSFDIIIGILSGNGADLEVQMNDPININIDNAYNQLVVVPPALDNTGKIYGANVITQLLKAIIATVEFYDVEPVSASPNTISEYYEKVKEDALENITHRIIIEAPQLFQSAQNISGTSISEVLSLFNELLVNNIIKEEIYNAMEDNYAIFGGSTTIPLTLDQVQTKLEDKFPALKKATIAGTFVANFLASMTENIFTNENIGIEVQITPGAGIFPEQAHNFQSYYYFDNATPNYYDLKYSWEAVDPETGTVLNDIYYSDVNVMSLVLLASDISPNEYTFTNLEPGQNYYYRIDTKDGINVTTGEASVLPVFNLDTSITSTVNNTPVTDIVTEATDYVFDWNEINNANPETYKFTLYDSNENVLETHDNLSTNSITLSNIHSTYGYILKWKIEAFGNNYEVKSQIFDLYINSPLPTLTTNAVTNITATSATSGGNITDNGGSTITARGVCYSTSPNPTTADNTTNDGTGTGTFTSTLTGLTANTTYYVRAYATNANGTAYGNEIQFNTLIFNVPTLSTEPVTNISTVHATSGGNISNNGGSAITSRGICYSTSPNPTINNFTTNNGTGIGSFTSTISGLSVGTTYYIRAYATNSFGTGYGNEIIFTTDTSNSTFNNFILTSQSDVDALGAYGYTDVSGYIKISGSDITSLSSLYSLSSVGCIYIASTSLTNLTGLENINNVNYYSFGGTHYSIRLDNNSSLVNIDALSNITSAPGRVQIFNNDNLNDLSGLNNLAICDEGLWISGNDNIISINTFNNLTTINGGLSISNNSSLVSISGFQNLQNADLLFSITSNTSLSSITGFNNLSDISLNLYFNIENNNNLTDLTGFSNITTITGGDFKIRNNTNLSDFCPFQNLFINGTFSGGSYTVNGNAYNPTQQDIIDGNCSQ